MKVKEGMAAEYAKYAATNSADGYSKAVVDYGERWASLMEERIAAGATISDCAEETSHTANTEGITGFMYGCTVSALARFWTGGEELRRWHNLKVQLHDEGEKANEKGTVLNPALITFTIKK